MSKFVMECPSCGRFAEASSGMLGFFATKKINCSCGYVIDVKTDKVTSKQCAHCGNMVVFDQSKGESALCPVCHEKVNTLESLSNVKKFSCPSCNCSLTADRNASTYTCPLCDTVIDVQSQLAKEKVMKEGLASVIKYEGDADTIVWKHPIEDFNMGSQLIVHESQEAIFFRDGQALDLFGAGRYTLENSQLPIMEKFYELPSGSDKTFHSEVYFINLAHQMALKWGTAEKINIIDPTSQAPIAIGARGMFNFKVSNARKLLLKLVGTTSGLSRNDVFGSDAGGHAKDYFRSIVQIGVSTCLADIIKENNTDILQIDQEKLKLSASMRERLIPFFDDYGMEIVEFLVEGIILPGPGELGHDVVQTLIKLRQNTLTKAVIANQTDITLAEMEAKKTVDIRTQENAVAVENARREAVAARGETSVLETQIEGQKEIAKAQADVTAERLRMQLEMERKLQTAQIEAQEMQMKGYNQKDVLQAQVMTAFAENQPDGGAGLGMGAMAGQAMNLGMGMATMGTFAGMASNMMGAGAELGSKMVAPMQAAMNNTVGGADTWSCSACGASGITSKFCPECGAKKPEPVVPGVWNCGACGASGITSKFCPECGAKKPEESLTWNCGACGATGITSKFCPECGAKKGV